MNNQTNVEFTLDSLLKLFGSSWTLDLLIVGLLTPVSIFGILSNIICYLILRKKPFHSALIFKYLRINVLNSIFVSFILSTSLFGTYRIFSLANTYASYFFASYFYLTLLPISYLYGNLLDIFTILERITYCTNINFIVKNIKDKKTPLILLIISVIINLPTFFSCYPAHANFQLNDGRLYTVHYVDNTSLQRSFYGRIVLYVVYFLRDIVTLLAKIVLNFLSVWGIHKHLKKLRSNSVKEYSIKNENDDGTKKLAQETMNKIERNLTYISIIMCVFSSMENIFNIVSLVYVINIYYNETALFLIFLAHLSIALKHSTNVFVLYFFNQAFKGEFKKIYFKC